MTHLLSALVAGILLGALSPADDADRLQGSWVSTTVVVEGVPVRADEVKKAPRTLVIQGERLTLKAGSTTLTGTLRLDPTLKPKALDVTLTEGPDKGKTIQGIYELDGDQFRMCYDPTGKTRPPDFSTKDRPGNLAIGFVRDKKP